MEVTVNYLGSVQFEIKARQHTIVSDQPEENGGFDEGMTPSEFLLGALGSCAAYYAVEYLKARKLATAGVTVKVNADKAKNPARMDNFVIQVDIPIELTEDQKQGVARAVDKCLVHNTLLHTPKISTQVASKLPAWA
jgi:uncharacterized OsmC-like protein